MKLNWYLQKNGREVELKEVEKEIKEELKIMGYKAKDVQDVKIYFNADEGIAYYTALFTEMRSKSGRIILF